MTNVGFFKEFNIIFKTFLNYLPSRFLVILNSIVIVPFFAYILSEKEMGLYQISIGILNLLCTCSTDWVTKSALRFYEKYKLKNKLPEFYSNILFFAIIIYLLIIFSYLLFANYISAKLFIPKDLLAITIILIIPCGLRQFLYQMLRVFNKPFLYTFSIIIYQFTQLILFLALFHWLDNVISILTSMAIGMFVIDVYILRQIQLNASLKISFDKALIKETLKYSIPTIFTNTGIWILLHINKFIFQKFAMFNFTAIAGIAWTYTTYLITPLLSTFLFAIFPLIIKKYEHNKNITSITTKTIQLYCVMFIPYIATFMLYAREIINTMFDAKYSQAAILIPFFAITIFLHELMKILNIKYHLKNKTYVEMGITFFVAILCVILNYKLISLYNLWGAGIAMLVSISILLGLHSFVKFKKLRITHPAKIIYTSFFTIASCIIVFFVVHFCIGNTTFNKFVIFKPILFLLITYFILWNTKRRVLV